MSLIPSAVQGTPKTNYFALREYGGMVNPVVVPSIAGESQAASLTINNGLLAATTEDMAVTHYVSASDGGGLSAAHYQAFLYGTSVGGNGIGELFDSAGLGNNYTVMSINRARPIDPARMGKIAGTGALQTIACPSITAGSLVNLAFVAGTPAAADVLVAISANTSFSLTLPAGAIYNYEVVG